MSAFAIAQKFCSFLKYVSISHYRHPHKMWNFVALQESHAWSKQLLFGCSLFLVFAASLTEAYGLHSNQMFESGFPICVVFQLSCLMTLIMSSSQHFWLIKFQRCTLLSAVWAVRRKLLQKPPQPTMYSRLVWIRNVLCSNKIMLSEYCISMRWTV